MARKKKTTVGMEPNNALKVEQTPEETTAQAMARKLLQPTLKNAAAASAYTGRMVGGGLELPGIGDYADQMELVTKAAASGDVALASKILAAQAVTLDSMFAELARRAALNMGEHMNACERYARLALKAQSNCRSTLEALIRLHQPRLHPVRHVHVNDGGQAVVADHFHNHSGANENVKSDKQSHATGAAGTSAALLSAHKSGDEMPVASRQRQATVQDARRNQPRST